MLIIRIRTTTRPPYRSVHMPSGRRISDPERMGVAASRPNSVSFRWSDALIGMPMMENMTQTAKQTVKASVLLVSTESCCRLCEAMVTFRTVVEL